MKEQIWFTNVKYLRLLAEHFMGISICMYTHVCTISKDIGMNKEREICLPNRLPLCNYVMLA